MARVEELQYYDPSPNGKPRYKKARSPQQKQREREAFENGRKYERELLRGIIDQALR